MTRGLSIRKRLARLEASRQQQVESAGREAFVVMGAHEGETHLEMSVCDGGRCWFLARGAWAGAADFRFRRLLSGSTFHGG